MQRIFAMIEQVVKTNSERKPEARRACVDYNFHDILGIRLVSANPEEVRAFEVQFGFTPAAFPGEPDLIVHYVDKLETGPLKLLGLDYAAFSDQGFYVLKSSREKVKVRIPFETIGEQTTLVCERGFKQIPLMNHIINLTLIKKGFVPVHASAFIYNGYGILVPGWRKGGKTEALLAFANRGATYVGDEWIILSPDGHTMMGIPGPTSLWEWHFQYIPRILPPIRFQNWLLFKIIHLLDGFHRTLNRGISRKWFPVKMVGEMLPAFRRQLKIWALPREIFRGQISFTAARVQKLFLLVMCDHPKIDLQPCDSKEIARQMAHSNCYEQMVFFAYYRAFKFAFPHLENDFLETSMEQQSELLARALEGKEAYRVFRPYPVSLDELYEKMATVLK